MSPPIDPGALLARYYALPDGTRVCLRRLRPRDRAGTRGLWARRGRPLDQLELARLTQFDPGRRLAEGLEPLLREAAAGHAVTLARARAA
jgi:hypothetical protein